MTDTFTAKEISDEEDRLDREFARKRQFATGILGHKYQKENEQHAATLRDRALENLRRKKLRRMNR